MTYDHNRGISGIGYTRTGMPFRIDIKSPVAEARNQYVYTATGIRLRKTSQWNTNYSTSPVIGSAINVGALNQVKTTDYIGEIEYENNAIKRIRTKNGYIENNNYYFYVRDHSGSNALTADYQGTIAQHTHYYPFGASMSISTNQGFQPYKFSDKELSMEHGLNLYDFHARTYDPGTGRFLSVDPMAEKYYSISPYVYCLNNPLRYVDPDGREVRIAEKYREQFTNDLRNVFGDKTDLFSFNENGTLQLEGKAKDFTKGMTKDQKAVFKGLNKAMSDKQVTSVVYENTQDLTIDGQIKSVDIVAEFGGGLYSKTDNMIVVAPNAGTVNVTLDQIQVVNGTIGFPTQDVQQNTTSTLFHEIGERNTKSTTYRGGVIDFENYARKVIELPIRPYDLNHSKTVPTTYKK